MQRPQPRRFDERDKPDDEERPDVREPRTFKPPKLLIGAVLIAIGVIFLILDDTIWATKSTGGGGGAYVPHGPVATRVLTVDGVRARPILVTKSVPSAHVDLAISFDNGSSVTRLVAPDDLRLVAGGHTLSSGAAGRYALRAAVLSPGSHVTGTLRFTGSLTPGMTLVFTPRWDARHPLRWALWR